MQASAHHGREVWDSHGESSEMEDSAQMALITTMQLLPFRADDQRSASYHDHDRNTMLSQQAPSYREMPRPQLEGLFFAKDISTFIQKELEDSMRIDQVDRQAYQAANIELRTPQMFPRILLLKDESESNSASRATACKEEDWDLDEENYIVTCKGILLGVSKSHGRQQSHWWRKHSSTRKKNINDLNSSQPVNPMAPLQKKAQCRPANKPQPAPQAEALTWPDLFQGQDMAAISIGSAAGQMFPSNTSINEPFQGAPPYNNNMSNTGWNVAGMGGRL
ncbi:hypothetical protein BT96DRAFT_949690 [Gymnopus androsaceus JB14]|uniref:Uncharacterized protein n=1 Tax=Gymnopus androsaceus JB14 TaxID=1447944 RepID=A0A6A4GK69_9AGAR|nr:hypothetical protein BT96DRAFT_949690 [Gymnopus androsaceus JB14]